VAGYQQEIGVGSSLHLIACRYKNFKCTSHNKFFELNLYQKDPVNRHHWRTNIARPAADIDLDASSGGQVSAQDDTKIEGRQSITIQKNTGDEIKVDSAKPASDFDDSIARVLAGIPKLSLEEVPEGHTYERHTYERHTYERHARESTPVRGTPARGSPMRGIPMRGTPMEAHL
jgi:hypothetical protein